MLLALLLLQLGATNFGIDAPLERPADAKLVWADEFDGKVLDAKRWRHDTSRNRQGWHNNERQYYGPDNARVTGGKLVITAERRARSGRRDWGGQAYSAARIDTRGKQSWTGGFFEIRAKIPCGRGTWPAIWMMPDSGTWPAGGEIDIMEHVGWDPTRIHATLHTELFTHSKGTQRGASRLLPTACGQFHRYQLNWTPQAITVGIDDRAFMRIRNDQPGGRGAWPFDKPFHLILNTAVGGDWGGQKGIDDAALPARFEIDYVRVWQQPNAASAPRR